MSNSVSSFGYCYGCGVCSSVCGKSAIAMSLNGEGFYVPVVDSGKCVDCGLCLQVCAYNDKNNPLKSLPINSWAAWSNNKDVRKKCSSGGIGFEIGKQLIEKGYKAVGCRYDIKHQRAEHFIATTVEDFVQSIGSKYIQSYTAEALKQIDKRQKYFISGTPCQIDSFRKMIQKYHCEDNFVLMDFFCHCVPSMWAWKAYIKMLKPKIGEVVYASWRNKFEYGWHDSWLMGIDGENTSKPVDRNEPYDLIIREKKTVIQSRWSQGDLFYKLFLGDVCCGKQCSLDCKYKYDKSSADIRIGDLWGNTYKDDEKGVSALVAFTERGYDIIDSLSEVTLIPHPFDVVAEGQMKSNVKTKTLYPVVMHMLKEGYSISGIPFKCVLFAQRVISYIGRNIK